MDDEAEKLLPKENSVSQEIHPAPEHSYSKKLLAHAAIFKSQNTPNVSLFPK